MLQILVNNVNRESPETETAISRLFTRKEKPGIEKKVANLNSRLKNIFARNQFHFIEKNRVDASCLGKKKLHHNTKGNYILAKKLCKKF